ncbi:DUF4058 family protein [Nostoc sp. PA-18-2419]
MPLLTGDNQPSVDLQTFLTRIDDPASYDLVIDYSQKPALQLL